MFKGNHAMTDGGGLISLCLAMNDTKRELVLPNIKVPGLLTRLVMYALSPIFLIEVLIKATKIG